MSTGSKQGKVIVISGPSGSGKTTLLAHLLNHCPLPLVSSVSATTRPPRPGERDNVDYHFLTHAEFDRLKSAGEFLECFEVYGHGHWYGTLWSAVTTGLADEKWVILEIDVQGMKAVLERFPDAVTIFLNPGSLEELERRLRARGTESEAEISHRLAAARREIESAGTYRFSVTNDVPERASAEICRILTQT